MNWETRLLRVDGDPWEHPAVLEAARLLQAGEIVALPTETVYGLAGDAANAIAVEKIFAAKQRPADNPLIVHIADVPQMAELALVDDRARTLAASFWPGPLTLVLPLRPGFTLAAARGLSTIALRMPDNAITRAVIRAAGRGLAAPSANLSGTPSPTLASHVLADLEGKIPLILDGGPCRLGIESTVLDLSGEKPAILRPGMVTGEEIGAILGVPPLRAGAETSHRSPGTRYNHYRPKAEVFLLAPEISAAARAALLERLLTPEAARVGYMGQHPQPRGISNHPRFRQLRLTPRALAHDLYLHLRAADCLKLSAVVIDGVAGSGQGVAMMDRLARAAAHFFANGEALDQWLATGT